MKSVFGQSYPDPALAHITEVFRRQIAAEREARANPHSWAACHPPRDTPEGIEFMRVSDAQCRADMELWAATDIEYDNTPIRKAAWEWRYWKVQARKCCWYLNTQPFLGSKRAAATMAKLADAQYRLAEVCGLLDVYKSGCDYIEEAFTKLKREKDPTKD